VDCGSRCRTVLYISRCQCATPCRADNVRLRLCGVASILYTCQIGKCLGPPTSATRQPTRLTSNHLRATQIMMAPNSTSTHGALHMPRDVCWKIGIQQSLADTYYSVREAGFFSVIRQIFSVADLTPGRVYVRTIRFSSLRSCKYRDRHPHAGSDIVSWGNASTCAKNTTHLSAQVDDMPHVLV
jgi:hypothetical protein